MPGTEINFDAFVDEFEKIAISQGLRQRSAEAARARMVSAQQQMNLDNHDMVRPSQGGSVRSPQAIEASLSQQQARYARASRQLPAFEGAPTNYSVRKNVLASQAAADASRSAMTQPAMEATVVGRQRAQPVTTGGADATKVVGRPAPLQATAVNRPAVSATAPTVVRPAATAAPAAAAAHVPPVAPAAGKAAAGIRGILPRLGRMGAVGIGAGALGMGVGMAAARRPANRNN